MDASQRILGGGRTPGVSFWPFLNSSVGGGLLVPCSLVGSPVEKWLMKMVTMLPGQGGWFQSVLPLTPPRTSLGCILEARRQSSMGGVKGVGSGKDSRMIPRFLAEHLMDAESLTTVVQMVNSRFWGWVRVSARPLSGPHLLDWQSEGGRL